MPRPAHARTLPQPQKSLPSVPTSHVDSVLELLKPLIEAVGATMGPYCEAVLHDLRTPEKSIVAIWNGAVTGRRTGGPVVGGPLKDVALALLDSDTQGSTLNVGYKTQTRDGRELRSTSLVLRNPEGKPVIAFCVNVDLSAMMVARSMLEEILRLPSSVQDTTAGESTQSEVGEVMTQIIEDTLEAVAKPLKFMDRDDRLRAVRLMHDRGLFVIRGGVERAASALGVSRFTLYSYLKEVRST